MYDRDIKSDLYCHIFADLVEGGMYLYLFMYCPILALYK